MKVFKFKRKESHWDTFQTVVVVAKNKDKAWKLAKKAMLNYDNSYSLDYEKKFTDIANWKIEEIDLTKAQAISVEYVEG